MEFPPLWKRNGYSSKQEYDRVVNKAWRQASPVYRAVKKAYRASRRASEKGAKVDLTPAESRSINFLIRLRDHFSSMTGEPYHLDHIVPLARGGIHHPLNLRVIPAKANIVKADTLTPEAVALMPTLDKIKAERLTCG